MISVHDKAQIERFLRRNTNLNIYSIGDLDDFFWNNTVWYASVDNGAISQLVLLYTALETPVLLAFAEPPLDEMRQLLHSILHLLPRRFYAHLTIGLRDILDEEYSLQCHGTFYKMALMDKARVDVVDTSTACRLSSDEQTELEELYRESYPGNWFDPRMLETGHYYGVRDNAKLVGVAGVHVYSAKYRVAALGNVTTHPHYRGRGIATTAVAKLCQELSRSVDHIGLNVKADNPGAISCYEKLGFQVIATYEECTAESK